MDQTTSQSRSPTPVPTPSGITERQNEPKNLNLLAAQRQLYTEEKRWTYLWYFAATVVALVGTGVLNAFNKYSTLITLLALTVALVEILLLPIIRRRRILAAGIQEQFDCEVLQLPWNSALTRRPSTHDINWAVERFKRRKNQTAEWESLKNWYGYSPLIKTDPLRQARIECQRENLYWDAGLRSFWRGALMTLLVVVVIALAIIGERANWSIQGILSGGLLLLIPLMFGVLKTIADHHKAMGRLEYLSGVLDSLKEDADSATAFTENDILLRTRDLQTEIYHHRCDDTPVPDEVYRWLKKRFRPLATAF